MGLAIVHRIVTDYNGAINVSSQVGAGTVVTVRLPIRGTNTVVDSPAREAADSSASLKARRFDVAQGKPQRAMV